MLEVPIRSGTDSERPGLADMIFWRRAASPTMNRDEETNR
jgi:hypothetical protein